VEANAKIPSPATTSTNGRIHRWAAAIPSATTVTMTAYAVRIHETPTIVVSNLA
jgi:hypothetical protein